MRYISRLLVDGRDVDGALLPHKCEVQAFVRQLDLESEASNRTCLGVLRDDKTIILIRHTDIQAQLYKHIRSVSQSMLWPNREDVVGVDHFSQSHRSDFLMQDRQHRGLEIDIPRVYIMIHDDAISVVETDINDGERFMSLYDFLMSLSRFVGALVMSWHFIRINCNHGETSYNILFNHDKVADRYFSKICFLRQEGLGHEVRLRVV